MEPVNKIRKTIAYYASYIAIGFATGIIGPTLPGLAEQTGTALSGISYLFPIISIGYLIGSFLSGRLFDRIKGHPVISVSLLLLLAPMVVIPLTPIYWLLMGFFFIVGLSSGGVDVGGNTLLIWVHRKGVGPFMVGLHFFYGLGAFIAPMVVGQALKTSGEIVWAYWILAIICAPVSIYFLILRSPKHIKSAETEGSVGENRLLVLLISIFMFLHVGAELSFGGWIYSYALKLNLANITQAAYLTSAYWGSLTAGRLISVLIAMKMKPRTLLVIELVGCIIAVTLLLLFPHSVILTWIGTILLGFSIAALIPMTFTFAGKNMDISGRVTSWFVIGIGTGNLFFPWLIGQLFEPVGAVILPVTNLITFVLALGLLIVIFIFAGKDKQTAQP